MSLYKDLCYYWRMYRRYDAFAAYHLGFIEGSDNRTYDNPFAWCQFDRHTAFQAGYNVGQKSLDIRVG